MRKGDWVLNQRKPLPIGYHLNSMQVRFLNIKQLMPTAKEQHTNNVVKRGDGLNMRMRKAGSSIIIRDILKSRTYH